MCGLLRLELVSTRRYSVIDLSSGQGGALSADGRTRYGRGRMHNSPCHPVSPTRSQQLQQHPPRPFAQDLCGCAVCIHTEDCSGSSAEVRLLCVGADGGQYL
jgi:hypothetical protein